jgi:hypothetical protein
MVEPLSVSTSTTRLGRLSPNVWPNVIVVATPSGVLNVRLTLQVKFQS